MARRAGRLLIGFLALASTVTLPAAAPREHRMDFDDVKLALWEKSAAAPTHTIVLLLHGVFDPYTPAEAQARSFVKFGHPDRQWVILPHSDHAAQLENAHEAFIAAIVTCVLRRPAK